MNQRVGNKKYREFIADLKAVGAYEVVAELKRSVPPITPRVKKIRDEENIHHTRTTIKGSKSWTTPLRLDPIISKGDRSRLKKKLKLEQEEARKAAELASNNMITITTEDQHEGSSS